MRIKESLHDAASTTILILGHAVGAAAAVAGVWGLECLIRLLWGHEDPLLFDRVPLRYMFDAADVAMIGAFIYRGARELVKEDR
jgi:hypothetical protein